MKKTEAIVQKLITVIDNKDILEAACGGAEFSNAASAYARSVSCIDLDDSRLHLADPNTVQFEIMDAAQMRYADETFDAVFLYNAFAHVQSQWEAIETECRRVLKPDGSIYIIATWKVDIALMRDLFGDRAEWNGSFLIVRIDKNR
ncbi:MAG: methyltransferase domain-containing protein [Lachnospiraceae bacterium]|nr:methyltransferase domain-containing protein [Lachnospiraceae bacterium]